MPVGNGVIRHCHRFIHLGHYTLTFEELAWRAGDVLGWVACSKLHPRIERAYPLAEAAEAHQAHRALERRKTAGKLLLIPR